MPVLRQQRKLHCDFGAGSEATKHSPQACEAAAVRTADKHSPPLRPSWRWQAHAGLVLNRESAACLSFRGLHHHQPRQPCRWRTDRVHGRALRLTCILAPLAPMIVPTTRFGTSIAHFSRPGTAINSLTADILRVVHGAVSAHRDKRAVAASATPPLLLPLLRHWKEVNACIRHSTGSAASLRSKCRTLARNATCTDTG